MHKCCRMPTRIRSLTAEIIFWQELAVVLVFGFAMFAGGIMRLPQLMDKIPPLCYLHHVSFLRYVLEAFYVAEANQWAQEIDLMYVLSLCPRTIYNVQQFWLVFYRANFCVTALCQSGAPTTPSFCQIPMITQRTHTVLTLASRLRGACCSELLYVLGAVNISALFCSCSGIFLQTLRQFLSPELLNCSVSWFGSIRPSS